MNYLPKKITGESSNKTKNITKDTVTHFMIAMLICVLHKLK